MSEAYKPIACSSYDLIEIAAMSRKVSVIVYHDEKDQLKTLKEVILDTKTSKTGEYVVLKDREIRMDSIVSLNGLNLKGAKKSST